MPTPSGPNDDPSSAGSGLPPHLDPRGARPRPSREAVPRVTRAYRDNANVVPDGRRRDKVAPGRRTRTQRTARILSWVALSMSVVVLAVAGLGWWAFNHYDSQISRISVFNKLKGHTAPAAAPRNAENYLLVGSDSRAGANELGSKAVDFVPGQRSDTIILVHLYGSSEKAQLVSFPRDSYVQIPAYTDPTTGRTRATHMDKINSAFSEGGAPLLIATIEQLSNIRIDHFLQIDFNGFKGMVNKLGGVDVCLTQPAKDSFSGIDLAAGTHHISGDVALAFVRQRHGLALGDIDRIARQQQFIGALVRQVLSAQTLLNPFKLNDFLNVATSSLQGDENLTGSNLKDLALRMKNFSSGGVIFSTVPISDIGGRRNGADVVLLDDQKMAALFDSLRRDEAPGTPAAPAGPATQAPALIVAPANVRVSVFNGSVTQGLARKASNDLSKVGFAVIGIPQTRGSGATQTTIFYGPSKADSARTLAAALPGAVLQADPSLSRTLEVVVGSSYSGAKAVTVTNAPSTPPSAQAAPPVKTAQNNTCTS